MTGREIKAIRAEIGMTQSTFAAKLGTDASVVSRWENEERSPDSRVVHILQCERCFEHYLESPYATLAMLTRQNRREVPVV